MRKLYSTLILFIATHALSDAQIIPGDRSPIDWEEKDLLLDLQNHNKGKAEQAEVLLNLNAYYLYLPGEETADLERASLNANQAKEMCAAIQFADGYNEAIFLTGNIFLEGGKKDLANLMFENVEARIQVLRKNIDPARFRKEKPGP